MSSCKSFNNLIIAREDIFSKKSKKTNSIVVARTPGCYTHKFHYQINPFFVNVPIYFKTSQYSAAPLFPLKPPENHLYPLKMSENFRISDIFRGYRIIFWSFQWEKTCFRILESIEILENIDKEMGWVRWSSSLQYIVTVKGIQSLWNSYIWTS